MKILRRALMLLIFLNLINCNRGGSSKPSVVGQRFGGMSEALASPEAFNEIRGAGDYSRFPLVFPFHIVLMSGECNVLNRTDVKISDVEFIGKIDSIYWGTGHPMEGIGINRPDSDKYWVIRDTTGIRWYPTLESLNLKENVQADVLKLKNANKVVKNFKLE